jgi:tetratricopeptide (TPR) repeat protein
MTRIATWFVLVMVFAPGPAVAQRTLFVEGLTDFAGAMMALSENRAPLNAAIDKMAAGLDGWEAQTAGGSKEQDPPYGRSVLLRDEAAVIPVLPLAAYADGFARVRRGVYREALVSLRQAAASASDERPALAAAARLAQEARQVEAERALRSIVTMRPESAVAHWWLGRVYENLNRIADARKEYEAIVPVALTGRATLYAAIGRLSHTEGDFARAIVTRDGCLTIISSFGNYGIWWSAPGCEIRAFIAHASVDYLESSLLYKRHGHRASERELRGFMKKMWPVLSEAIRADLVNPWPGEGSAEP